MKFTRPEISEQLRKEIIDRAKSLKIDIHETGTYIQTRGPRFETKAEVKMFSQFADVVGMTISSEATLACEAQIPYAVICSVDNYAHGIGTELGMEEITRYQEKTLKVISRIIEVCK